MDKKLESYQRYIIDLLEEYAQFISSDDKEVKTYVVADQEHYHYILMRVGWEDGHFIYDNIVHLDIIDEKVWLQCNWTDSSIAEELIEKGVARNDIVLGFIPATERQYTDYAAYPAV